MYSQRGFTLPEVLVGAAIIATVTTAAAGLATLSTRTTVVNEQRTVVAGIVESELEAIRTLKYEDVGYADGTVPDGVLEQSKVGPGGGEQEYVLSTTVELVDDLQNGQVADLTEETADYKKVTVSVDIPNSNDQVSQTTLVVPPSSGGATVINVDLSARLAGSADTFLGNQIRIDLDEAAEMSWLASAGAQCEFTQGEGAASMTSDAEPAGQDYMNNLGQVNSPSLSETTTYIVRCERGTDVATDSLQVIVQQPEPVNVTLTAESQQVGTGESAVLTWSATGSPDECEATGGSWQNGLGDKAAPSGSENTTALTQDTVFAIECTNTATGLSGIGDVTVLVRDEVPAVELEVKAEGASDTTYNTSMVANSGDNVVLRWQPENVETCLSEQDWTPAELKSTSSPSTETVTMPVVDENTNFTYSIFCKQADPSKWARATASVLVLATDPVGVSLTAAASPIQTGTATTLSWSATGDADECEATGGSWQNGLGDKAAPSGSEATAVLVEDTIFELRCTNTTTGRSGTATVTVGVADAVPLTLQVDVVDFLNRSYSRDGKRTAKLPQGEIARFTWTASGATDCGNGLGTSGSQEWTFNIDQLLGISCINAQGDKIIRHISAGVPEDLPGATRPGILIDGASGHTQNFNQVHVLPGQDVLISWDVPGAESCVFYQNSPNSLTVGGSGSITHSPSSGDLGFSCTDAAGGSVWVNVPELHYDAIEFPMMYQQNWLITLSMYVNGSSNIANPELFSPIVPGDDVEFSWGFTGPVDTASHDYWYPPLPWPERLNSDTLCTLSGSENTAWHNYGTIFDFSDHQVNPGEGGYGPLLSPGDDFVLGEEYNLVVSCWSWDGTDYFQARDEFSFVAGGGSK